MKTAIMLHGTGGSNTDYYWFSDTKKYLEEHGYNVWWPLLPNADKPDFKKTRDFVRKQMPELGRETIILGHSSACPLILHLMESFAATIKQVILVAGYYQKIPGEAGNMLPERFEWEVIKGRADEIIFINSDNDPWKCTDAQARLTAQNLEAPLIINFGQGHMGSDSFNQPYKTFPLLKRLLSV
jgi:predicted alpha/beta hydrolase family esterase